MPTTADINSIISIISLIASIASLILAIVAIWLSIAFFKISSNLSTNTTKTAADISLNVQKLEYLFDHLYADTFSVMKNTITDITKHAWPDGNLPNDKVYEEAEKKANEKVAALEDKMGKDVSELLNRQKITDEQLQSVKSNMQELLHNAIQETRQADNEAREETMREYILKLLSANKLKALELVSMTSGKYPIPGNIILEEISKLQSLGYINWAGTNLSPSSMVTLTKKGITFLGKSRS
jgi:hypothetical protein